MSDSKKEDIGEIVSVGAQKAVDEITKAMSKVEVKEDWQATILGVLGETIDNYGVAGIKKAEELVWGLIEGKPIDNTEFAKLSLRLQADVMEHCHQVEAEKKSKFKDFMAIVGDMFGGVLVSVAKGMITQGLK